MLKKGSLRRILLATTALFITGIIYIFPEKEEEFPQTITYKEEDLSPIYLIDLNDYVARTEIYLDNKDPLLKSKEIISALTIGSTKSEYIKNGFTPIIPKNTKLLNISLENNLLKIDFSKEFLSISKDNEIKVLESIVFSLTDIDEINEIMIFVENNKLTHTPITNKRLPTTLTRDFGINKVYDLETFTDTSQTTIYYIGEANDDTYYIPITYINNDSRHKVEIVINNLKSAPIYQTNIMSYLASSVELLDYEISENIATLNFNEHIYSDLENKDIIEEVKYTIFLSLKENHQIDELVIHNNDEFIENFKI